MPAHQLFWLVCTVSTVAACPMHCPDFKACRTVLLWTKTIMCMLQKFFGGVLFSSWSKQKKTFVWFFTMRVANQWLVRLVTKFFNLCTKVDGKQGLHTIANGITLISIFNRQLWVKPRVHNPQECATPTYPAVPTEFQVDVIINDAILLAPVIYNMCTGVNASHVFLFNNLYRIDRLRSTTGSGFVW